MTLKLSMMACISTALAQLSCPAAESPAPDCIPISSKASLLHLGSLDSFDITEGGKQAAKHIIDWIDTGNTNAVAEALQIYKRIIPNENFGGEYTALQWICEYALASASQRQAMLSDPLVENFHQFFSATNYNRLKRYVSHKYHLNKKEDKIDRLELRFLEDFILFNNPRREQWEKTSKIMEALHLKPGDSVADVGSGPGYYTFKFAKIVGPSGHVYASEINPRHCEFLTNIVQSLGFTNVSVIHSRKDEIGISGTAPPRPDQTNQAGVPQKSQTPRPDPSKGLFQAQTNAIGLTNMVDLVFLCSLYHILYTDTEENLSGLIDSIKKVLNPDGTLAIIDNALVQDSDLPYHGPFIAKELIITQLKYYGFRLEAVHQFIPQRYLLLFKQVKDLPKPPSRRGRVSSANLDCIEVGNRQSLLRLQGFMPREKGQAAASNLLAGLEQKQPAKIRLAREQFTQLIPVENFGAEYLALQWFCDYLLDSEAERPAFLAHPLVSDYFHFFADNDWAVMKEFLKRRNNLADFPDKETSEGDDRMAYLLDVIFFNNPRREQWEKTSQIIKALKIKRGAAIADVGCGTGYYTFRFSDLVGEQGRVFAIETNDKHVAYISDFTRRNRVRNVRAVQSKLNDICVDAKVDMVFLCSLYPMVYVTSMEKVKDQFIGSIKRALKDDGKLVIVDNDLVEEGVLPYHASCMDRRLIIAQLKYYGFRLVETHQFIPQRYMLVFQKE